MGLVSPGIGLIFWMTVTFSIVLFILAKFAWKPILKAIKEREESISSALNSAKEAEKRLEQLKSDNEKLLQETRIERDKVLAEAKSTAVSMVNKAKDEASAEGAKMLDAARSAIETEKNAALSEIKILVGSLSVEIAEKILKNELKDTNTQKDLVESYLKDVKIN